MQPWGWPMRGLGTDHVISANVTDPPPANSTIIFFWPPYFCWPLKKSAKIIETERRRKNVSSLWNIRRKRFDQRSLRPLEKGVLNSHRHTDRHPDRPMDLGSLWLNRPSGADSVKSKHSPQKANSWYRHPDRPVVLQACHDIIQEWFPDNFIIIRFFELLLCIITWVLPIVQ